MNAVIHDCPQRSLEWFKVRRSVTITASEMGAFLVAENRMDVKEIKEALDAAGIAYTAKDKKEDLLRLLPSHWIEYTYTDTQREAQKKHIARKLSEPIYADQERPDAAWLTEWKDREELMIQRSAAVQRGTLFEEMAKKAYEEMVGAPMETVGFIAHPSGCAGASPDLVQRLALNVITRGCEMKVPLPETHIRYLIDGVCPDEYLHQVHGNMAVSELDEWDFFSFCPGLPSLLVTMKRSDLTERLLAGCMDLHQQVKAARKTIADMCRQPLTPAA